MVTFREVLSRGPMKLGLMLLILSLVSAVVAMQSHERWFILNGNLSGGRRVLLEPSGLVVNSTLTLKGHGTVMVTVSEPHLYTLNDTRTLILHLTEPPTVAVLNGTVFYTMTGLEKVYPYSNLAIPAFITMIAGTVLVMISMSRFVRDVKKERDKRM